jgi:hypothetical protein
MLSVLYNIHTCHPFVTRFVLSPDFLSAQTSTNLRNMHIKKQGKRSVNQSLFSDH